MLRVLLWLGQFVVVAPSVYETLVSLFGLRTPAEPRPGKGATPVRVVVPAHDEEGVIQGIAADLATQDYPRELLDAWVIADRSSDATARLASAHVSVAERSGGAGGKGAAISWFLSQHPLREGEALVVLDADNRIDTTFIREMATALESGHHSVQAYLDVSNPDASVLTMANALTYWASNRSVQLARSNIGWSCDLGGTGMAVSSEALAAVGGFEDDLTDDLALNVRLNLAGYRTHWLHHVHVRDEKPTDREATVLQRARWVRGKRQVQHRHGRQLFRTALGRREPSLMDLGFRLYNPGRSFLALLLIVLTVVAAIFPDLGLWPVWVLGVVTVVVVALPVLFLAIDGVPGRYLIRYPYVVAIGLLWVPIRIASRLVGTWRRTPHTG
jgi:cellulose synthase/poly-beta-1,6-N-acetylglucosamine synthase-like glycosyltransferase